MSSQQLAASQFVYTHLTHHFTTNLYNQNTSTLPKRLNSFRRSKELQFASYKVSLDKSKSFKLQKLKTKRQTFVANFKRGTIPNGPIVHPVTAKVYEDTSRWRISPRQIICFGDVCLHLKCKMNTRCLLDIVSTMWPTRLKKFLKTI